MTKRTGAFIPLIPLIAVLLGAAAAGEATESFKIAGKLLAFQKLEGLLVHGCESKPSCEALRTVQEHPLIQLQKARSGQRFNGSVGSDVCKLVYRASSVLGITEQRDQRSFCRFPDGSMIENNSLGEYLTARKAVL